jgi:hypothetical protein
MNNSKAPVSLPIVLLRGTAREMGRAYAAIDPSRVEEIYATRLQRLIDYCAEDGITVTEDDAAAIGRECMPLIEAYSKSNFEEYTGIAEVCRMPVEKVWMISGHTDLRDYLRFRNGCESSAKPGGELEGCSTFFAGADATSDRKALVGQTWDLGTEDMHHVILQHRKPDDAPECFTITVSGALPMIGMNEHGIACLTNDLNPGDGRLGVCYIDMLSNILRCDNLSDAVDAVLKAPRISGHNYLIADGLGLSVDIEATACDASAFALERGVYVHTNHYVDPQPARIDRPPPRGSDPRRYRMHMLMQSGLGGIDVEFIQRVMSDRYGTYPINRYDDDGMSTNACLIMSPVDRELHACRAQADRGEWLTMDFELE